MVNHSTNINKTKKYLSPQTINKQKKRTFADKSHIHLYMVWFSDLIGSEPAPDYWIWKRNTDTMYKQTIDNRTDSL